MTTTNRRRRHLTSVSIAPFGPPPATSHIIGAGSLLAMMKLAMVVLVTICATNGGGRVSRCQGFAPTTNLMLHSSSYRKNQLFGSHRVHQNSRSQSWVEKIEFRPKRPINQLGTSSVTTLAATSVVPYRQMVDYPLSDENGNNKWNQLESLRKTTIGRRKRLTMLVASLFRRTVIFPSWEDALEFPAKKIQESHERYLRSHQIVKKRRVLKRALNILTILSGDILRPLLCSLVKEASTHGISFSPSSSNVTTSPLTPSLFPTPIVECKDWDAFWRLQRKPGGLTNAQRVAQGVPALGPTFVKAAQIASTRPDILPVPLAEALGDLKDKVPPFDNLTAKRMIRTSIQRAMKRPDYSSPYIHTSDDLKDFMKTLTDQPVAAASVAQVYRGTLPGFGPVAVKVLRPGIRRKVEKDATLFHSVATWVESWNNNTLGWIPSMLSSPPIDRPLGSLQLVQPVDEFTSRVLEDMDFVREVENIKVFSQLYDRHVGTSPTVKIVVPQPVPELCSDRILVMEWLEGTKLTDVVGSCGGNCDDDELEETRQENLKLVVQAIECTISQLIDHGLLHGDPHSANLLKVYDSNRDGSIRNKDRPQLGYLDFGLVSYVPQKFRDGIVCAVVQLVFARNIEAVADLCGDLDLLPDETLQNPEKREEFVNSLKSVLDEILIWPKNKKGISTAVPKLRFENLLPAVAQLVRKYEFNVPPYFFQNIRALATLEGMGRALDPDFNVLRVVYPYSINRLMRNPSVSSRVQETFVEICKSPDTTLLSPRRVRMLLNDWAMWTGYRKRKVFWDLLTSAGGRRVAPVIFQNFCLNRLRNVQTSVRYLGRAIQYPFVLVSQNPADDTTSVRADIARGESEAVEIG